MNKNKGIIGIGLILAIVLGIVVVGGGAYYLGKSGSKQVVINPENILPNVENQNLPVDNSQQVNVANTTTPTVATGCTSTSTPSIKVLSPNGGEVYKVGDKITVKWSSCNVSASSYDIIVALHQNGDWQNVIYLSNGTINDGSGIFIIPTNVSAGNYKIRVGSSSAKIQQDFSDNAFTINSATKKVSSELPKYIGSAFNSWPPVIKHSSVNYSCTLSHTQNQDVFEKIINNRKYCITDYYEGAAGTIYHTYTYITSSANGDGTETSNFTLGYGCGGYGGPGDEQYDQCNLNETTFKNNLNQMIDTLISK